MKGSKHTFGTRTGSIDIAALRGGIASPGMDTRYWCSRGTVGTVDDEGEIHYDDPHAVWIGPEGVECDVILEPLGQSVTAVWAGGMAGDVTDLSPIHPGDQVLVECPDGDLMTPVITAILHSRSNKQPRIAGRPIFDNKRRLIYVGKGDLDTRVAEGDHLTQVAKGNLTVAVAEGSASLAAGGQSVWVKQGQVQLGSGEASHPVPQGDTQKQAADALADAVQSFAASLTGNFVVSNPMGAAAALTALTAAVTLFKASMYLSDNVKTT